MKTETVSRTIPVPLETSNRKRDRVDEAIDRWQDVARWVAEFMPSYDSHRWSKTKMDPRFPYTIKRKFPEYNGLRSAEAMSALHEVAGAFVSWDENGCEGDRPLGEWGDGSYMIVANSGITIEENDRGFGVRLALEPYAYGRHDEGHEWFHICETEYERPYLEGIVDGEYDIGASELRTTENGAKLHLVLQEDVDVYETDEVEHYVGVDLGENVLYTVVVRDEDGNICEVELEDGAEFRHRREEFDDRRDSYQERNRKDMVHKMSGQRQRYTEQVCHVASRRIVDIAAEYAPSCIVLEDLTNYRQTATNPIHDWPYDQLQRKITYKATECGLPVESIDPRNTSITCRKCGTTNPEFRDGVELYCPVCDYEIHADVNAAMNIAQRGMDEVA